MNWSVISRVAPYGIPRPSGPYNSLSPWPCRCYVGIHLAICSLDTLRISLFSKLTPRLPVPSSVAAQVQNRTHSQRYRDRNRSTLVLPPSQVKCLSCMDNCQGTFGESISRCSQCKEWLLIVCHATESFVWTWTLYQLKSSSRAEFSDQLSCVDLQLQWKSCGMQGSNHQLLYQLNSDFFVNSCTLQ